MAEAAETIVAPLFPLKLNQNLKIDSGQNGAMNNIICVLDSIAYRDAIIAGGKEAARLLLAAKPYLHENDRIELRVPGVSTTDAIVLRDPAGNLRFAVIHETSTAVAPVLPIPVTENYVSWWNGQKWCICKDGKVRHDHFVMKANADATAAQLNAASPMSTLSGG
jgi:hypothetical protein